MPALPRRLRKLIGTVVLLVFLTLYALLVMTVAVSGHLPAHGAVEFAYYVTAGIVWAFPARYLIVWMLRPDPQGPAD